eukprot:CAMPEP_0204607334 /NCGR_PEP_ID=MMETSP0661-20131031/59650_1 /ASSEMBLY_ACC=CAM_ASM_000606 /TAXON_ID=109239 /ORGANISM="Alexandrium margalefi, Strain AMGDE01CS-322" /LENGTH=75 /DNA_ID=CAMNT_0051618739 /DNA_START=194 /DNA_END=421 /DNA_ORIENTATION=+
MARSVGADLLDARPLYLHSAVLELPPVHLRQRVHRVPLVLEFDKGPARLHVDAQDLAKVSEGSLDVRLPGGGGEP